MITPSMITSFDLKPRLIPEQPHKEIALYYITIIYNNIIHTNVLITHRWHTKYMHKAYLGGKGEKACEVDIFVHAS